MLHLWRCKELQETLVARRQFWDVWKVLALTLPLLSTVGAKFAFAPKRCSKQCKEWKSWSRIRQRWYSWGCLLVTRILMQEALDSILETWDGHLCSSWMFMDKIYKILHQGWLNHSEWWLFVPIQWQTPCCPSLLSRWWFERCDKFHLYFVTPRKMYDLWKRKITENPMSKVWMFQLPVNKRPRFCKKLLSG